MLADRQTDRHTDTLITTLRSPINGGVKTTPLTVVHIVWIHEQARFTLRSLRTDERTRVYCHATAASLLLTSSIQRLFTSVCDGDV